MLGLFFLSPIIVHLTFVIRVRRDDIFYAYLLQYIRYLYSGRHYKGNYLVTYEDIKALGYRSHVNEYYKKNEE